MLYLGETQTLGEHHDRLSNASPITLSPFPPPYAWHFLPASPYRCLHFFGLVKHRRKESCLLLFRKPVLAASSDHESSQPAPLGFSWLWQEFPTKSSCFSILLDKTSTSTSNCPSYCCAPTCATQTTSQPVLQVYQALDSQVLLTVPPSSRP